MPMTQDDIVKYKTLYVQTAGENIRTLQEKNALLMKGESTEEIMETMQRSAHSLKSESLLMGYNTMGQLALTIEKLFQQKKEKNEALSAQLLSLLEVVFGNMKASLEDIEKNNIERDLSEEIKKIEELS